LEVKTVVETVAPGSHASNGAAEVTVKLLQRQANLLIQQLERGCGIPEGTIGCQHPLYSWAILHGAWLHNRYVVKQGHTAYELCADRTYRSTKLRYHVKLCTAKLCLENQNKTYRDQSYPKAFPQINKRESNFPCSLAQITPDNKQRFNTHSVSLARA